jgi:alcohol dehydrogenase (cytochrome c)
MNRLRVVAVFLLVAALAGGAALWLLRDQWGWRVHLLAWKVDGSLPELTWSELAGALSPGNDYLQPDVLFDTGSLFMAITNPRTSSDDVGAGRAVFTARCLGCHAEGGGDSGPDLGQAPLEHGASDWALYRNIVHGIPGTAMAPVGLTDTETWQVIAYVHSRRSTVAGEASASRPMVPAPGVTAERLVGSGEEPENWLTYSGGLDGHRHSRLDEIDSSNAGSLHLIWAHQSPATETRLETSPLVVDGIMYLTESPNDVVALDGEDGREIWRYSRRLPDGIPLCCGMVNRGLAILGDALFLGTLDAHLVSLDARTGRVLWETEVTGAEAYSITSAPLAANGRIITGTSGGGYPTRGFVAAYDAATGEPVWRFHTIPGEGEPGNETWSGDSWRTGGAAPWFTGSFDPDLDLIYWGVGNPAPMLQGASRAGENLYSNSVVALEAETGDLRWFFQFTPHDENDWDAAQIPVLVDREFMGESRRLLLTANKNGFYYVLDRETGEFLTAEAFGRQTWAEGIGPDGAPIRIPGSRPTPAGTRAYPGVGGATSWWSPSYSPQTGMIYIPVLASSAVYLSGEAIAVEGELYLGGAANQETFEAATIRALDAASGEVRWEFDPGGPVPYSIGGVLSTAGGVIVGGIERTLYVLDAETGARLWERGLGGNIAAAPVAWALGGRQRITIAAGRTIFTFGLAD